MNGVQSLVAGPEPPGLGDVASELPNGALRNVLSLCFGANALCFLDRINIAVAAPLMTRELGWNEAQMGAVFSAFFCGYVVFMIPGGVLADRFGARRVLAWGVGFWSLFTAATPLFRSLFPVCLTRYLVGTGQGVNFPCITNIVARHVPVSERARAQAFVLSGISVGSLIGLPLASWIATAWGWAAVFYTFGLLGAFWLVGWLRYTGAETEGWPRQAASPATWRVLLTHPSPLGLTASYFCHNYASYFLLAWLPTYLIKVHGFSVLGMGLGSAVPAAASVVCMNASGWYAERLVRRGWSREASLRRLLCAGMAASALSLAALPWVRNPYGALAAITLSTGFRSLATPAYWTLSIHMAPRHAGLLSSLMNTSGNIAGIVAPGLSGLLVAWTAGWGWAIGGAAAITVLGALVALPTVRAAPVV